MSDLAIEFGKFNFCHNKSDGQFCTGSSGGSAKEISEQKLNNLGADWVGKLTREESKAIDGYCGSDYVPINETLRKGRPINSVPLPQEEFDTKVKLIDSAIAKHTLAEDVYVYRGFDTPMRDVLQGMKPGDQFIDKGFVSTTVDMNSAGFFGNTMVRIRVPKGTHAAPIDGNSTFSEENEMLLPRNTKFMVKTAFDKWGQWQVEVEVL